MIKNGLSRQKTEAGTLLNAVKGYTRYQDDQLPKLTKGAKWNEDE